MVAFTDGSRKSDDVSAWRLRDYPEQKKAPVQPPRPTQVFLNLEDPLNPVVTAVVQPTGSKGRTTTFPGPQTSGSASRSHTNGRFVGESPATAWSAKDELHSVSTFARHPKEPPDFWISKCDGAVSPPSSTPPPNPRHTPRDEAHRTFAAADSLSRLERWRKHRSGESKDLLQGSASTKTWSENGVYIPQLIGSMRSHSVADSVASDDAGQNLASSRRPEWVHPTDSNATQTETTEGPESAHEASNIAADEAGDEAEDDLFVHPIRLQEIRDVHIQRTAGPVPVQHSKVDHTVSTLGQVSPMPSFADALAHSGVPTRDEWLRPWHPLIASPALPSEPQPSQLPASDAPAPQSDDDVGLKLTQVVRGDDDVGRKLTQVVRGDDDVGLKLTQVVRGGTVNTVFTSKADDSASQTLAVRDASRSATPLPLPQAAASIDPAAATQLMTALEQQQSDMLILIQAQQEEIEAMRNAMDSRRGVEYRSSSTAEAATGAEPPEAKPKKQSVNRNVSATTASLSRIQPAARNESIMQAPCDELRVPAPRVGFAHVSTTVSTSTQSSRGSSPKESQVSEAPRLVSSSGVQTASVTVRALTVDDEYRKQRDVDRELQILRELQDVETAALAQLDSSRTTQTAAMEQRRELSKRLSRHLARPHQPPTLQQPQETVAPVGAPRAAAVCSSSLSSRTASISSSAALSQHYFQPHSSVYSDTETCQLRQAASTSALLYPQENRAHEMPVQRPVPRTALDMRATEDSSRKALHSVGTETQYRQLVSSYAQADEGAEGSFQQHTVNAALMESQRKSDVPARNDHMQTFTALREQYLSRRSDQIRSSSTRSIAAVPTTTFTIDIGDRDFNVVPRIGQTQLSPHLWQRV